MNAMKRTILVGASMFALVSGVSAQVVNTVNLETYQANWQQTNNITTMTPALYEQMKIDWINYNTITVLERVPPVELTAVEKQTIKDAQLRQEMGVPSDYPLMQNTGDPAADADNYQLAKALWKQNNPAAYNQMISTPTMTDAQRQQVRQQELNNQN